MKKAIKTTVVAAGIAAAGLLGAGAASADTTPTLADGNYTLDIVHPIGGALAGPLTSVSATVTDGRLYVGPAEVPVTLQPSDDDGDGVADSVIVLFGGSTWGQLR